MILPDTAELPARERAEAFRAAMADASVPCAVTHEERATGGYWSARASCCSSSTSRPVHHRYEASDTPAAGQQPPTRARPRPAP
ncbi:hypothetical protein [Streptomyces europaeiscabiei]|uniref:hypothetical protein n=1 Tax=Streptomyces europaeiscabiei TaxID=146819 RepID=UPI0029AB9989|nr:hypothetical protein [Streptomyces europaeiscabiei]MDX2529634.1 hypothetical protein [Streptomyces europaeiscabiei]MDX2763837.1 hypothetical protein [Streptomyces europaeiscabiei]MDX2771300.1 hypothetical protein [Streptomyces europaeiscabiei]MDX3782656.1 hypothetical protein [Streptomyces europaeiscabiei]MDX3836373.1 hypothetical protein [Streptomyces europaeiscabiei]